jgi:ferredoxin
MRRALVNYWVDMVTGVAFLLCAVTGIVRLFPAETVSISSSGQAVIFGISVAVWQTIHDWSGAIMAAGVGVHTVLHLRWLAHMTRRIANGDAKRKPQIVPVGQGGKARVPATATAATAADLGGSRAGAPRAVAAAELERLERRWEERRREKERRHTRKAFLKGAAAVGGVALLVGLGLASRDAAGGLLDLSAEHASADKTGWEDDAEAGDPGYGSDSQGSGTGSESGGSSSASGATARVVVDSGSCVGCGACLQVCPAGVFAANGGVVTAQTPDACSLCGRCTQVCRPGAITLSA